jgi:hypothetical protein
MRLMRSLCCLRVAPNVARQRLGETLPRGNEYKRNNRRTVGRNVFYAVCFLSNTQHAVKRKQEISCLQIFSLYYHLIEAWISEMLSSFKVS